MRKAAGSSRPRPRTRVYATPSTAVCTRSEGPSALRAAPLEPLTHPIALPERRRRVAHTLRPVQAAVAVLAVVAVGAGALSSSLRAPGQSARSQRAAAAPTQRELRDAVRFRQLQQGEVLVLQRQAEVSRPVGEQYSA